MAILMCCGREGLREWHGAWQAVPCPLRCASLMAVEKAALAVVDDEAHLIWTGSRVLSVAAGIEAVRWWRGRCLLLSGDTDCLTLMDARTGTPLILSPAGVYPQDLCLLPEDQAVAVCGGAEGAVLLLSLPELTPLRRIPTPGQAQRIACAGGMLHVLCAAEDDGLRSVLCRVSPRGGRCEVAGSLPGLPGALQGDGHGGVWAAASEGLYHFSPNAAHPDRTLLGQGLIRHMALRGSQLLTSDPVLGQLTEVDTTGRQPPRILYEGDVRQAIYHS